MRFGKLQPGRFISRPNRFAAWVEAGGRRVYVHVPNSGRLAELLVPGAELRWRQGPRDERKTAGDLVLVRAGRLWVCVDARVPPRLLAEALGVGLHPFGRCTDAVFEPALAAGRADLAVSCGGVTWLVETKSVTLARGGVAMFPDAPTARGRRHLEDLAELARSAGTVRAAVAFICQRPDVYCFRPNAETDPAFAEALGDAAAAGVAVVAYRCSVGVRAIAIADRIPVQLAEDETSCGG